MAKPRSKAKKPISLDEVRQKAEGEIVEIPDWSGDGVINVRIRKPDMTPFLLKLKDLPNSLKRAAVEVFEGKKDEEQAAEALAQEADDLEHIERILPIIEEVSKATLLEPTYDELQDVYPLTIVQKMALFRYATSGLQELESFRTRARPDDRTDRDSEDVQV